MISSNNGRVNGSRGKGGGLPRIQTAGRKALELPAKKVAGRQLAARGQDSMKIARPDQAIPQEDGDSKVF